MVRPPAEARGLSLRTGGQTLLYLSHVDLWCIAVKDLNIRTDGSRVHISRSKQWRSRLIRVDTVCKFHLHLVES